MIRNQVITEWTNLKETIIDIQNLALATKALINQADYGGDENTKLVRIKDKDNTLKTIKLNSLPNLVQLRLSYSPTKASQLTSLTIKDCSNRVSYSTLDYSCLWQKSKYFSQVKELSLHYLPSGCFPEKFIDFSAYSSLEKLEVEINYGWNNYEEIIFQAPNLKILNWRGGQHIEQIKGLESCKRLEIVRIRDATVSKELGERLKNHPRYLWAKQHKGEDSWEWVVESNEGDWGGGDDEDNNNQFGPTIEEVE